MKNVAFFDTKPYDHTFFDAANDGRYHITYFDVRLNADTAALARGADAVCAFVNDTLDAEVLEALQRMGIPFVVLRCAGYNNVDMRAALDSVRIARVPVYSPYAVAEHTMGLLLCLNRKIHRAYNRTRDFNFSLQGFTGIDLFSKQVGIIGTGNIGRIFAGICRGFGMRVLAYDPYPAADAGITYVDLPTLLQKSDVISLHCPLTKQTRHLLNAEAFRQMKRGVYLLNTSRGALIHTPALLDALNSGIVRGAGLDVYEEEAAFFFEDLSGEIIGDDILSLLLAHPNVLLTAHQAFLTEEALGSIAHITLQNLDDFFVHGRCKNEVCLHCADGTAHCCEHPVP